MKEFLLQTISLGTIILLVACLFYLVLIIFKVSNPIQNLISKYRIHIIFLISLLGVVGSLLLTIYFQLEACQLCWYQRVFLFCIPVITAIALIKDDMKVHIYTFWLALFGLAIAFYHSLLQAHLFVSQSAFCNPTSIVDCSIPAFTYFGFVTIPVISFAVFLMLTLTSYESKKR